ncbi:MAG: hypothetical protein AAFX02_11820, partial [Pseudomonadota bacterium]
MSQDPFINLPIDFSELRAAYERDIEPELISQEALRSVAASKSRQFSIIGVLAALVIGGAGFFFFRNPIPIIVGALVGLGCYMYGANDLNK